MLLVKVGLAIKNPAVYIQHEANKHVDNEGSAAYHLREESQKNYDLSQMEISHCLWQESGIW